MLNLGYANRSGGIQKKCAHQLIAHLSGEQKLLTVTGKKITILSPSKLNALLRSHLGELDA